MTNKFLLLFTMVLLLGAKVQAQQGGNQLFTFLNQAPSSYSASQGGLLISYAGQDVTTALQNPATLNELTRNAISFNHTFLFSGISSGYVSYANYWKKRDIEWHTGVQYIDYGEFQGADEWGNKREDFTAGEYAFTLGATKHLNEKFHVGVNTTFLYSRLENYIATGIGFDIGGFYTMPDRKASIGVVAKNIGFVTKSYTDQGGILPFDLQIGFSKRLKHLPFQYNITAHHLYTWDIRYDDPALTEVEQFEEPQEPNILLDGIDNAFRHLIFGGEFLLGKKENLKLRMSYNHMLRREMTVRDFRSLTGFSGGVELKVKQFFVGYSFRMQHLHGSVKTISLTTNFERFKRKKG